MSVLTVTVYHNDNNSFALLQVNVYNVLKAMAQQVVLVHYRM